MKHLLCLGLALGAVSLTGVYATTISLVSIHEPLSLHGTDVDGEITEAGEALQATVAQRPMALTGAFPEDLITAIRTPHRIPSNNPNYQEPEANLLVLCNIGIHAEAPEHGKLRVTLDITKLTVPEGVDLTARQTIKLALIAVRKTLEAYQNGQAGKLKVTVALTGATEGRAPLADLASEFTLDGSVADPENED